MESASGSFYGRNRQFCLILLAVLFLFPFLYTVCESVLPPKKALLLEQTPWFAAPQPKAVPDGVLEQAREFPILERRRIAYLPPDFNGGQHFPVDFVLDMYRVRLPSGQEVWCSPDLVFHQGQTQIYTFGQYRFLPALFSALLGLLLILFFRRGLFREIFGREKRDGEDRELFLFLILFLLFLKQFLLSLYLSAGECVQARLIDESCYLKIGYELFHTVTGKWNYPVGYPLLIAGVMAVTGGSFAGIQQASEWISVFNGFLLFPAVYALLGVILYRFTLSLRRTFLILLALILIPFFVFPCENFTANDYTQWIDIPLLTISYKSYYIRMWTSLNALSDPSSVFFVLLCIFLALFRGKGIRNLLLISALFGFSCLVRLNNIFFAPLLAYLFLMANRETYRESKKTFFRDIFSCAFVFLLVFSPQFFVNYRDFSSIWIFPYVLHEAANAGFEIGSLLGGGMKYYTSCNQLLFSFGCASLFFMKKGFFRTVLILWIVPLVLFFSGYVCFSANPVRFILPSLLGLGCAAGCCQDVLEEEWGKREWGSFFFLLFCTIASFNPYVHEFLEGFFPGKKLFGAFTLWCVIKGLILFVPLLLVLYFFTRTRKKTFLYFGTVLFFLMLPGEALWFVLPVLLVMGAADFARGIFGIFSQRSQEDFSR